MENLKKTEIFFQPTSEELEKLILSEKELFINKAPSGILVNIEINEKEKKIFVKWDKKEKNPPDSIKIELQELTTKFSDSSLIINILDKNISLADEIIGFFQDDNLSNEKIILSSFTGMDLKSIKAKIPSVKTSFTLKNIIKIYALYRSGFLFFKKKFDSNYFISPEYIGPSYILNPGLIKQLHKKNIKIYAWAPNSEKQIDKFMKANIEGIILNDIELLNYALEKQD